MKIDLNMKALHVFLKFNSGLIKKPLKCRIPVEHRQTCHSIEMRNLYLTNKKSGSRGKNRDHGRIGYTNRNNSPKERTNSICSFFLPRNVLNCQTSVFF